MKTFLRSYCLPFAMFAALVATFCAVLVVSPATAEAGCSTTTITTSSRSGVRSSSATRCSAPRVKRCHFTSRCTPQRTCVTRSSGRSSSQHCTVRDVCKQVQVCS